MPSGFRHIQTAPSPLSPDKSEGGPAKKPSHASPAPGNASEAHGSNDSIVLPTAPFTGRASDGASTTRPSQALGARATSSRACSSALSGDAPWKSGARHLAADVGCNEGPGLPEIQLCHPTHPSSGVGSMTPYVPWRFPILFAVADG
jgi:hypothetical protein